MYRIFFIIILLLTCSTKLIDNRKNHEIILINIKGKTTSLCIYNELIIIDGDTIKLRSTAANTNFEKPPIKKKLKNHPTIRLDAIDSPEIEQPHGVESSNYLYKLIKDKNIHVITKNRDKYGRLLGKIFLKEQDVNLNMVKSGNAHWNEQFKYQQSFIEQRIYKANQKQAKKSKLGLWQSSNVILPSEWRYKNKETKTNK